MKCIYHPNREAVTTCSVCKKHICADCSDSLLDKVICKQCKIKVAQRVHDKLIEQQSEERKFAYSIPVASVLLGISFLVISISIDFFLPIVIIALILLAIGIILFLITYALRKKGRYIQEEKPTRKKKIGWILIGVAAFLLAVVLPASAFIIEASFVFSISYYVFILVITVILFIIGGKLAKW